MRLFLFYAGDQGNKALLRLFHAMIEGSFPYGLAGGVDIAGAGGADLPPALVLLITTGADVIACDIF